MSRTLRVEEETCELLTRLKGEDESFDDAIERLLTVRRERIEEGAGFWEGTNGAEKAREKSYQWIGSRLVKRRHYSTNFALRESR